ncbi:gastrin-releasing peptide receptor [Sarotherodon galilaeus]
MSPLFMDSESESTSPGSTAGSERERGGQQMGPRGTKRREKNRDAARKSRRKQTERADELHEELQSLERSNSALQKDIAALKKELHFYTTSLERHEPYCRLPSSLAGSSSADCQTSSNHHGIAEVSDSNVAASSPLSFSLTSMTSSLGLQSIDCVKRNHVSPPATTTLASSAHSSPKLFNSSSSSSSSPVTIPYSASFTTYTAPHSLFSKEPIMTSSTTNGIPICDDLFSNPVPSGVLSTATQPTPEQDTLCEMGYTADGFFKEKTSFLNATADATPPYSHLEAGSAGVVAPGCVPQLPPCRFSGNQSSSIPPSTFLPSPLQNPLPPSLLASAASGLEPSPVPSFSSKQSYDQDNTSNSVSLLSLLTVPGPLDISQATSSSFDRAPSEPPPLAPQPGVPSKDLDLCDLYDWLISGHNNQ